MCFPGRGTHITRDMCFPGRGTHITRDMCFPGRGTHISRDMSFLGREVASQKRTCISMLKQVLFFFLFYNFFNRPFFSLLFYNLQTVKTLKQPVIAPVVGARILRTLLSHALLPFDVLVLHMHAFSVLLKYACHGHVFLHVSMTFLVWTFFCAFFFTRRLT